MKTLNNRHKEVVSIPSTSGHRPHRPSERASSKKHQMVSIPSTSGHRPHNRRKSILVQGAEVSIPSTSGHRPHLSLLSTMMMIDPCLNPLYVGASPSLIYAPRAGDKILVSLNPLYVGASPSPVLCPLRSSVLKSLNPLYVGASPSPGKRFGPGCDGGVCLNPLYVGASPSQGSRGD